MKRLYSLYFYILTMLRVKFHKHRSNAIIMKFKCFTSFHARKDIQPNMKIYITINQMNIWINEGDRWMYNQTSSRVLLNHLSIKP